MPLIPYKNFLREIEDIEIFHLATLFSYDQAIERRKDEIRSGYYVEDQPIMRDLQKEYRHQSIAADFNELSDKLKIQFPSKLREIILIRLISVLEVFLVDMVREIFVNRKELFKKDEKLNISYNLVLSYNSLSDLYEDFINKECRMLQNSGIDKLSVYFKNNFGIDFNSFSKDIKSIKEVHERRHLFVHRLGKVDEKYKRDYNYAGEKLSVDKKYIINAFETFREFAGFINQKSLEIISPKMSDERIPQAIVYIEVEANTPNGRDIISVSHMFQSGERIIISKDLIFSRTKHFDYFYTLGVSGGLVDIDAYITELTNAQELSLINIMNIRYVWRIKRNATSFPWAYLEKIDRLIPYVDELPIDIHKELAKITNLTRYSAYAAIKQLKEIRVTTELFDEVEKMMPQDEIPQGFHKEIAQQFDMPEEKASFAVSRIIWKRKRNL
ncbi:hypothetical protein [Thiothrix sp.]|jgi:hypothetical protein|uniref:hypothetical protein n=1 Tax=Thiothrix sp. TaxID=1032 RepID=UPI00257A8A90|nr:hypothetical protein [Thiothrix sp.]